jgi:hypothetical protein
VWRQLRAPDKNVGTNFVFLLECLLSTHDRGANVNWDVTMFFTMTMASKAVEAWSLTRREQRIPVGQIKLSAQIFLKISQPTNSRSLNDQTLGSEDRPVISWRYGIHQKCVIQLLKCCVSSRDPAVTDPVFLFLLHVFAVN